MSMSITFTLKKDPTVRLSDDATTNGAAADESDPSFFQNKCILANKATAAKLLDPVAMEVWKILEDICTSCCLAVVERVEESRPISKLTRSSCLLSYASSVTENRRRLGVPDDDDDDYEVDAGGAVEHAVALGVRPFIPLPDDHLFQLRLLTDV
jgi:hypothetical protein